jgi:hypothetical protein
MTAQLNEALVRDILRVLCRIAIPRGQLQLYRVALMDTKNGFSSGQLKELLHLEQAQHRGLMAALTIRINNTPHEEAHGQKPGAGLLFRQRWDGQQNTYWPRPEFLEAIRRLPRLAALMARPLAEVASSPPLDLALPEGVTLTPPTPLPGAPPPPSPSSKAPFHTLLKRLDDCDLLFPAELVANLLLALQVKRLVILTGISGTGKTRIGQVIASHFQSAQGAYRELPPPNVEVIAVRADWTDHRGLLGHYNPLTQEYVATPFLHLLLQAHEEHRRAEAEHRKPTPFFALLDEMNLARVEHYFADFLSALESGEALHLHDVAKIEEGEQEPGGLPVPRRLAVPPNLFFIGTVNVDESTYFFSPKVLDRAFAIEFDAVDLRGLASGSEVACEIDLTSWNGQLDPPAHPGREDWKWLTHHQGGELTAHVNVFHDLLARYHRHFGYRVATEVARFVRLAVEQAADPEAAAWAALDLAVLQKVLVKLNGTQAELQELLQELLELTLAGTDTDKSLRDLARWKLDPAEGMVTAVDEASDREPALPRSAAKLWRMRDRLQRQGFTSWIE